MTFICDSCEYETSNRLNPNSFKCPECGDALRIITDKYPKKEKLSKHIPREKEDVDLKVHNHRTGFTWDGTSTILMALLLLTFIPTQANAFTTSAYAKESAVCSSDPSSMPFELRMIYYKLQDDGMDVEASCLSTTNGIIPEIIIKTEHNKYIHTFREND